MEEGGSAENWSGAVRPTIVPSDPNRGALRTDAITATIRKTMCTTFVRTSAAASESVSSTRPTSSTRDRTRSDKNKEYVMLSTSHMNCG
eukprot:SAG22_NODE_1467_length_4349_cov_3.654353_3_plen_89_part_00